MFIAYFNKDRLFVEWDEFSHWGKTVKNMYYLNTLANQDYNLLYKSYPPATAIFQYLLLQLKGSYSEGIIFSSMPILYFSLVMPFYKKIKPKSILNILVITIGIVVIPIIFYNNFYTSIYVDALLGILFAYILLNDFFEKNYLIRNLGVALGTTVLCLTKSSGQGLAVLSFIITCADSIYKYKQKNDKFSKKDIFKFFKTPIFMFSGLFFALVSWKIYTHVNGIVDTRNPSGISVKALIDTFIHHQGIGTSVVRSFISFIVKRPTINTIISITSLGTICLLLILALIVIRNSKANIQPRMKILFAGLSIGSLIYFISLCFIYIFSFSEYEAKSLASVERYVNTYLLGFFIITIGSIINNLINKRKKGLIIPIVILAMLTITNLSPIYEIAVAYKEENVATQNYRAPYKNLQEYTDIINSDDNLSLLCTEGQGLENLIYQYEYMDELNISGYDSIGTAPYYGGDIWTKVLTFEEYELYLTSAYDFLYVVRANEKYNEDYGCMFEIGYAENNTLYHIEKNSDGSICMKKLDN
ncbi:MAG: hypothetical protein JXN65_11825 [Clostridia bacterium]|nr:hypothetical protein [Clostridia bacterium]